ncbi:hypothetical protein I6F15_13300 [Bradyrhizobium sp. BRP14]|nr:hypothetical protein [Bradyrhizobium sp. BRP14]
MASIIGWKDRASDLGWRLITSPFTIGVYIAVAIWIAFLASAKPGIPAHILMAAEFLLVIFVDPPERLAKLRELRRGSALRQRQRRSGA